MTNYGYKQEKYPKNSHWYFGGYTGIIDDLVVDDWTAYLPSFERQKKQVDMFACVTFSALNVIETIFNYYIAEDILSNDDYVWLKERGYIDIATDKINFSDRYIAKLSGTTKSGNYVYKVGDAIREYGLIPECDWDFPDILTWEQYYQEVPEDLKRKGKEFIERFPINYEFVLSEDIAEALKYSPLQVGVYAWTTPVNGVYPDNNKRRNHFVMKFRNNTIFDHYLPDIKRLEDGYKHTGITKYKITLNKPMGYNIPNNTLIQLIEGVGGFALVLDGKKIVDDLAKVQASFLMRNNGYIMEKCLTVKQDVWDSMPTINLKKEPIGE